MAENIRDEVQAQGAKIVREAPDWLKNFLSQRGENTKGFSTFILAIVAIIAYLAGKSKAADEVFDMAMSGLSIVNSRVECRLRKIQNWLGKMSPRIVARIRYWGRWFFYSILGLLLVLAAATFTSAYFGIRDYASLYAVALGGLLYLLIGPILTFLEGFVDDKKDERLIKQEGTMKALNQFLLTSIMVVFVVSNLMAIMPNSFYKLGAIMGIVSLVLMSVVLNRITGKKSVLALRLTFYFCFGALVWSLVAVHYFPNSAMTRVGTSFVGMMGRIGDQGVERMDEVAPKPDTPQAKTAKVLKELAEAEQIIEKQALRTIEADEAAEKERLRRIKAEKETERVRKELSSNRQSEPESAYARVYYTPQKARSEERRVGKEGRSRWSPYH